MENEHESIKFENSYGFVYNGLYYQHNLIFDSTSEPFSVHNDLVVNAIAFNGNMVQVPLRYIKDKDLIFEDKIKRFIRKEIKKLNEKIVIETNTKRRIIIAQKIKDLNGLRK